MQKNILNIAHRGSRYRSPENTMSSFSKAIEEGADYLELDVRLSGDGHVVVSHDARLNRTSNGSGRVRRQDLSQLKALDFGAWFHEDFKNEAMPTLKEVLDTFPKTGLNIEIKAPGMEAHLVQLLQNYSHRTDLIVSSFFINILKRVQNLNSQIPLGLIISQEFGWQRKVSRCKELNFFSVHLEQSLITKDTIQVVRNSNLKMIPWTRTILSDERIIELIQFEIYGLINDFPEQLPNIIKKMA